MKLNLKIALIDNMNNNFFALARYLRQLGIDAHLFLNPSASPHFSPQCDTFEDISKLDYIHTLPFTPNSLNLLNPFRKRLNQFFKDFDTVVACGPSLAYLKRDGVSIDLCVPYGADLITLPFAEFNWKNPIKSTINKMLGTLQKQALQTATRIVMDDEYKLYREAFEKLNIAHYNMGIPMVYPSDTDYFKTHGFGDWDFLNHCDFTIFNHSRQYWASNMDNLEDFDTFKGAKRNDKLIRAYAKFVQLTEFKNPKLVLFEYGPDIDQSKQLISQLSIEDQVWWMPICERRYILEALKYASLSSNAFREGLDDLGGVCLESLAAGVPLLNNIQHARHKSNTPFYSAPIIHALGEEDILHILMDYEKDPEKYRAIGKSGKAWFHEHFGMNLAKRYLDLILEIKSSPE